MKAYKVLLLLFLSQAIITSQTASPSNGQQNTQGQDGQGQTGQQGQNGQSGNQESPTQLSCLNDILRSYMLRGRFNSEPDKMVLCPAMKNNCCTKLDQQRIYHIVNDIMPQRVVEYQSKMKMAMAKLKKLHDMIIKTKPSFTGSPKRRMFCGTASRKVFNFSFTAFYNKVIEELESIRPDMDKYYKTFFCNICDAENHPYIELKKKKVTIDAEFCQKFLQEHEELLQMLNVELVEYLESLQHLVDCNHYLKSYNLKFFDSKKQEFMKELGKCINNLSSKNFLKSCKSTCENIMLSKVNILFEGDFEFLIDAVNLFEKFFQFKESGNFISMKLRLFFKKFVIPRKLKGKKRAHFLRELKAREAKEAHRKVAIVDRKLSKIKKTKVANKVVKKSVNHGKSARNLKDVKKPRRNIAPLERSLIEVAPMKEEPKIETREIETEKQEIKLEEEIKSETTKQTEGIGIGRILTTDSKKDDAKQQDGKAGDENQSNNRPKKKTKKAQLVYNKELFNFYSEIKVMVPAEKQYVFKIRSKPSDIDKFDKIFAMHDGINPDKYLDNTKFELLPSVFYKQLFAYRKPDQPDPNLLFFLTDFTPKLLEDFKLDLTTNFKIKQIKMKKKKGRILSILDRSEKSLNENFLKKDELKDIDLLKPNN